MSNKPKPHKTIIFAELKDFKGAPMIHARIELDGDNADVHFDIDRDVEVYELEDVRKALNSLAFVMWKSSRELAMLKAKAEGKNEQTELPF